MKKDNQKIERAFGPFFLSIEDIRPYLLNPQLEEIELVNLIREMSVKFTKNRAQIGDYVLDEDHVSAYAALYLTTNIPKLHFLLSKLPDHVLDDLKERPLIDIGSGPGTFALGWSLLFEKVPSQIICVDSSKTMLLQSEKIIRGFFPEANLKTQTKYNEKNSESVLFFGHSINEMGIHKAQDLIMTIDPEYVIWIEPGTSEFFSDLKKLRIAVLESYDVLYPCPSSAGCPSSWCHQVLRTSHDLSVERLSQLVSLDRKILPMAAHIYRRKKSITEVHSAVTVRFLNETKFSFEYEVCMQNSVGENRNVVIEIQKKQLSKEEEKSFKNANVGERLDFEIEKEIQQKQRVKLKR